MRSELYFVNWKAKKVQNDEKFGLSYLSKKSIYNYN